MLVLGVNDFMSLNHHPDLMNGYSFSLISRGDYDSTPPYEGADFFGIQARRAAEGVGEYCGFQLVSTSNLSFYVRTSWNGGSHPVWSSWMKIV